MMCLVRQGKIDYVALEGLTGVERMCPVRQCKIGWLEFKGFVL